MKHVRIVARIKYGFVELVVILFTFNTRCDYVIPFEPVNVFQEMIHGKTLVDEN